MARHNRNLDILRGVAASIVVFRHLSDSSGAFDGKYGINDLVPYYYPGLLAVLVFFIMSGYVIGFNHPTLDNREMIGSYIKKRLVRILPIYFVAMLFTIIVTHGIYGWKIYLSNMFFVSVPLDNVIWEASPLWSLQYELLYYFAFIFFAYYRISLAKTIGVLLLAIAALFIAAHHVTIHPLVISVLIGFLFWITGVLLAQKFTTENWTISNSRILSVFILIFCLFYFNPYSQVIKLLHIHELDYSAYSWYQKSISFSELFYYPLAVLLILTLIHGYWKYAKYLVIFLFTCALGRMASLPFLYDWHTMVKAGYILPSAILTLSFVLWLINCPFNPKVVSAMKSIWPLSGISYAIYIMHRPLFCLFVPYSAPSGFYFVLKISLYLIVLLIVSYALEIKFQHWVKGFFFKKKKAVKV